MENSSQVKARQDKKWDLITGASGGIGHEYAKELARRKYNLILVARSKTKLEQVAGSLSAQYSVDTRVIAAGLSSVEGVTKVIADITGQQVETLINNAGQEESGYFLVLSTAEMLDSLSLNCSAPLLLTHQFANKMTANGGGNILFRSSIVAFQGVPLISNYAAAKAYLLTLVEGISAELTEKGVNVSIAALDFTASKLSPQQSFEGTPMKPMKAAYVAKYTLVRMGKKLLIIPGGINKFLFYFGKYMQSRKSGSKVFGKVFSKMLRGKLTARNAVEVS